MAARVAAALSELMGGHSFFQIIGPAAVKAAVSAFEQVDIARGPRARRGSSLRARRAFVGAWGHTARFLSVILCHDGIRNPFVRIRISYKKIQGLSITRRMHDSHLGSPIFCLGALEHFPSAHARFSSRIAHILSRRAWTFPFSTCAPFPSAHARFSSRIARIFVSARLLRAAPVEKGRKIVRRKCGAALETVRIFW